MCTRGTAVCVCVCVCARVRVYLCMGTWTPAGGPAVRFFHEGTKMELICAAGREVRDGAGSFQALVMAWIQGR